MVSENAKDEKRLFPFAIRARILILGQAALERSKGRLHFVLVTTDVAPRTLRQVQRVFEHYPIVQRYASAELEEYFGVKGVKVLGFAKSELAKSIYGEIRDSRLSPPEEGVSDE